MNAGASPAGRGFAIRNSDLHFDRCGIPEETAARIRQTKQMARDLGREVQVWLPVSILCRPTQKEVDEYLEYCIANGDWRSGQPRDRYHDWHDGKPQHQRRIL